MLIVFILSIIFLLSGILLVLYGIKTFRDFIKEHKYDEEDTDDIHK